MAYYTPEEVGKALYDLLQENAGSLGISYVGFGNELTIPSYPAVIVAPGMLDRALHGTHKFRIVLTANLWVYHAKATQSRKIRTQEDLELVTRIRELLHQPTNFTLGGNIIHGFVEAEEPGTLVAGRSIAIIGTRMSWMGIQQKTFM